MKEEKRKNGKKNAFLLLLLLLLLGISVGFATLQAELKINGTSTIHNSTWDISTTGSDIDCPQDTASHVYCTINPQNPTTVNADNGEVTTENPNPKGAIIWMDGDTIYFKHVLEKPGDVFTFDVTYTNNGSVDAELADFQKSSLNATAQQFLTYTVTYDDNTAVAIGNKLAAGATATFRVTVSYKDVSTLPTAAQLAAINEVNEASGASGAISSFTVTYEQD